MKVLRKEEVEVEEFKIGDQIRIKLKDIGEVALTAQKVTEEGTYFMFNKAVVNRCMNSSGKNNGGFKESDLYKWLNGEFLNLFPAELKERIKDITIPTYGQIFGHDDKFYDNFEPDNDNQLSLMKDKKNRVFFDLEDKWCWSWLQNASKKEVSKHSFCGLDDYASASIGFADFINGVIPIILMC